MWVLKGVAALLALSLGAMAIAETIELDVQGLTCAFGSTASSAS